METACTWRYATTPTCSAEGKGTREILILKRSCSKLPTGPCISKSTTSRQAGEAGRRTVKRPLSLQPKSSAFYKILFTPSTHALPVPVFFIHLEVTRVLESHVAASERTDIITLLAGNIHLIVVFFQDELVPDARHRSRHGSPRLPAGRKRHKVTASSSHLPRGQITWSKIITPACNRASAAPSPCPVLSPPRIYNSYVMPVSEAAINPGGFQANISLGHTKPKQPHGTRTAPPPKRAQLKHRDGGHRLQTVSSCFPPAQRCLSSFLILKSWQGEQLCTNSSL